MATNPIKTNQELNWSFLMIGGMSAVLLFGVQIFYRDRETEKQYRMQLFEEAKVLEAKYERHLVSKS